MGIEDIMENVEDNRTKAQRWSDNIAEFCGSWGFVIWLSGFIAIWVSLNTWLILSHKFDEYPFILLNLFLTVISTIQTPIVMMSQNRQVQRDKERDDALAERDREMMRGLHVKLDQLLNERNK
jgi:uncharacterized membrane protein